MIRKNICTILGHSRSSSSTGGSEMAMIQIQDSLMAKGFKVTHVHVNYLGKNGSKLPYKEEDGNLTTYNLNVDTTKFFWEIFSFVKILNFL